MTWIIDSISKPRRSARHAAGLAIGALLVLATVVGAAHAEDRGRRGDDRGGRDHGGWHGGYYRAPPVVYGGDYVAPGYYPPPVVYGPGIGISLPFINLNIR